MIDFQHEIHEDDKQVWFYAEECGTPDNVGVLVQAFLEKFKPAKCWGLTWACTCDKPRCGEFDGGAMFVTAKNIKYTNSTSWLTEQGAKFNKKHAKK